MTVAKLISATIAAAVLAAGIAGCAASAPAAPVGIALVAGQRANSAAPDTEAIRSAIPAELPPGSVLSLTGISGSVAGQPGLARIVPDLGSSIDDRTAAAGIRAGVLKSLATVAATTAEADDLSAIATAARSIAQVRGDRTIVVADSMLQTGGVLDFTKGLLAHPAEEVAAKVPAGQLPALSGYEVVVIGQGAVAAPQPALGTADRAALRGIWAAVLQKAGAKSIRYVDGVSGSRAAQSSPPVSIVVPTTVDSITFPASCTAVAPSTVLTFAQGSAEFGDRAAAERAVAAIAARIQGCAGTVHVDGTTSSEGGASFNAGLSLRRARAVAVLLAADLGVAVDSMDVRGLGSAFPGFVKDTDARGALVESVAALNRSVRVSVGP